MPDELPPMPLRARFVLMDAAQAHAVDPRDIASKCRKNKILRARIEVARRLDQRGFTTSQIGRFLNHDHTTVVFYLARGKKKPSPLIWRMPAIRVRRPPLPKPSTPPPPQSKRKPEKFYLVPYAGADRDYRPIERPSLILEKRP